MKRYLLLAGNMLAIALHSNAQDSMAFTIHGKMNPSRNNADVMIVTGSYRKPVNTTVKDGEFSVSGSLKEPGFAMIRVGDGIPADYIQVYIAGGKTIELIAGDSIKYAKVKGNEKAVEYHDLYAKLIPVQSEETSLRNRWMPIPEASRRDEEARKITARRRELLQKQKDLTYAFIDKHPKSTLSFYLLKMTAGTFINYSEVMPHFQKLDLTLRTSAEGIDFEKKINGSRNMQVGTPVKNFESTTPEGTKLSLREVMDKGTYTLVDFWASWCTPCRAENPTVVKAYGQFHPKGLNIISVSLDDNADKWKAAIRKDGMPWYHVSSLVAGFKDPIAQMYGINAIPQNALVNSKGVIVAVNLRGDALLDKLEQLFAQ
ncbi:redoxin domain-containing protein [Chitinophaga oryziterrae]|uniref:Redoxin domain-containing protein n=1 Tax=Chitinophaga oryziterrae TaxID=1031224 RepID=A0A6N8J9B0_9BACT|nr:TlpA disulfide reductase family protein [Chitinophaga oryziterrae]MVT41108.1 redoxin domain-containing protein [Chitinophaga oryziterrae]